MFGFNHGGCIKLKSGGIPEKKGMKTYLSLVRVFLSHSTFKIYRYLHKHGNIHVVTDGRLGLVGSGLWKQR